MLEIDITGHSGDNLILEVNGHRNNGRSSPKKGEQVYWKVKNSSGVNYIEAITMKSISGSVNVFSDAPHALNSLKKEWRGTINRYADSYSVYVYTIDWIDENGNPHTFDPILSIRPTPPPPIAVELIAISFTAVAAIIYGLYWRKKYINRFKK